GLVIAFNAGGHNAGTIDWGDPTILLKTERMRDIKIDPATRRARVEAGVLAKPLASAAAQHGLAFLSGTSADVGVTGYALGGGLSWLGRRHGLACNSIVAADVVLADGRLVRADSESEPELFWAIRGGGGNVGAVTALEFELIPLTEVYAGALFWPIERAREILSAWRRWIDDMPDTCQSLGRMLQLPDAPFLPEHLRGRSFVLVEAAFIGSEAEGVELLRPLRALEPEFDSFTLMPPSDLSLVNMDPEEPVPYDGDGTLLDAFPPEAIDRLVEAFVGSPLLHVEVRQLGGALAASSPDHGVLDAIDQPFVLFTFGLAFDGEMLDAVQEHARTVLEAMRPWDSGRRYLNFTETAVDPRTIYPEATFDRLLAAKERYDPNDMFRANHPLRRTVDAPT
ncbi:MAG TPA: FAD-binding protein, partial [Candidatus Limnocylindrales bacterium]|nr:FAD-binding protein [Candidatus Limnocylindrales bacterium]